MSRLPHRQITESVFIDLCNAALATLPPDAFDEHRAVEERELFALEHLLNIVRDSCGIEKGPALDDPARLPRAIQLKQEIIALVDAAAVNDDPSSTFFLKQPLIDHYVVKATGRRPE